MPPAGSLEDIATQFAMMQEISSEIETSRRLTQQIDTIRSQLNGLIARSADDAELRAGAERLERSFAALADSLVQQKPGGFYMWPVKLTAKLIYLANHVQSSDYAPTQQAGEAHAVLRGLLAVADAHFERLVRDDLRAFNEVLGARSLQLIEVVRAGG